MRRLAACFGAIATLVSITYAQTIPTAGMTLSKTTQLKAGTYLIPAPGDETGHGAIRIRGNGITVDFAGATLRGTPATTNPDERKGVGVEVSGSNITIKNLKVSGYKVALIARNVKGLKIVDSDFSYNWKQHLLSTEEKEDYADWQSYHQNPKDEWLRYGAGIYLRGCDGFEVRGCRIVGGQCGLMITSCNKGLVWNNDFSFNSGLGMGMQMSSDNRIMHNKMDWDVRGFSYGVYNRGQDSAGLLIFEQCNRNILAYNSITHGGDGFFLWAGQTTMDTGLGGCNDNLLYGNDWSHAPTNGIEATFSRNKFINNLIMECWHGVWAGYSYDTDIIGNVLAYNTEGIALEQGQNNRIRDNIFYRDQDAIHLWAKEKEDPNFVYSQKRDVRSMGYDISGNVFSNTTGRTLITKATSKLTFGPNSFGPVKGVFEMVGPATDIKILAGKTGSVSWNSELVDQLGTGWSGDAVGKKALAGTEVGLLPAASSLTAGQGPVDAREYASRFVTNWNPLKNKPAEKISVNNTPLLATSKSALKYAPKPLAGGIDPFLKSGALRGWRYMFIDEWGPYDFQRPVMVDRGGSKGEHLFEILGPKGKWKAVSVPNGVKLSASTGVVPGYVTMTLDADKSPNIDLGLEYVGGKTVDYRGIVTPAGQPVKFGYKRFFVPVDWKVAIYGWSKSVDPTEVHAAPDEEAYQAAIAGTPLKQVTASKLDYAGYSFLPGTPNNHFATVADGEFTIDPGKYIIDVTTDDGARVWLDGKQIVNEWHYQGPTAYSVPVTLGGKHKLHVEHFQIDGYATLKLAIKQAR